MAEEERIELAGRELRSRPCFAGTLRESFPTPEITSRPISSFEVPLQLRGLAEEFPNDTFVNLRVSRSRCPQVRVFTNGDDLWHVCRAPKAKFAVIGSFHVRDAPSVEYNVSKRLPALAADNDKNGRSQVRSRFSMLWLAWYRQLVRLRGWRLRSSSKQESRN